MTGALVALAFVFGVLLGTLQERDRRERRRWRQWFKEAHQWTTR